VGAGLFCSGVEFPIQKLADRRKGIRGNFDEIGAGMSSHLDRDLRLHYPKILSLLIYQLDLGFSDFLVDAKPLVIVILSSRWL
jgi:hypothetical protein